MHQHSDHSNAETEAGTASANFGIVLIPRAAYDIAADTTTVSGLVTAGGLQIKAIKYKTVDGVYTVSAVLYNLNETAKDDEVVAIAYVGNTVLSGTCITSYNAVTE